MIVWINEIFNFCLRFLFALNLNHRIISGERDKRETPFSALKEAIKKNIDEGIFVTLKRWLTIQELYFSLLDDK